MFSSKKYNRGFTLIEILITVAIIGVLAAIVVVSFNKAQAKSRDSRRVADVESVKAAMNMFYDENKRYVNCNDFGAYRLCTDSYPSGYSELVPAYFDQYPKDPLDSTDYIIAEEGSNTSPANPQQYGVFVAFENTEQYGCAFSAHAPTRCSCKTGKNMIHSWFNWSASGDIPAGNTNDCVGL